MEALLAKRVDERPVAGFNLVAAIDGEGLAVHYDGVFRPVRFGAGAHVLSSDRDLDDPAMPEKRLFDRTFGPGRPEEAEILKYLSSHEGERPVCKHNEHFGTVSSTLYVEGAPRRLLHAPGPPCRTPFAEAATSATP